MKRNQQLRILNQTGLALLLAAVALSPAFAAEVPAKPPAVDPAATQILKRMSDYLGSLKNFSVYTQNTIEDLTESGHRVDVDVSARVVVSRPNRILAERRGDVIDQDFFYDGKSLTLCNPAEKVYATVPAPATIGEMLQFAHNKLGLIIPVSDLVYSNCFPLLMQQVTSAAVMADKAFINGVKCNHVLFSRPGVDFQVWVADSGPPLPMKYLVTDTGSPALLSVSAVMSKWDVMPDVSAIQFTFVPPAGHKPITFMPVPAKH